MLSYKAIFILINRRLLVIERFPGRGRLTSLIITFAPNSRHNSAMALPIPEDPPRDLAIRKTLGQCVSGVCGIYTYL